MSRYRKKPVVIEAVRYDGEFPLGFLGDSEEVYAAGGGALAIRTLEGTMTAQPGDWIIRGVKVTRSACSGRSTTRSSAPTPRARIPPGRTSTTASSTDERATMADDLRAAAEKILRGAACREWDEAKHDICGAPGDFVLWGKLLPAEALGPRCLEHAEKHVGWRGVTSDSGWALVDLRPLRKALA